MLAALRWSAPVDEIAERLIAQRPTSFAVRHGTLKRSQRVDFVLTPLQELVRMDAAFPPLEGESAGNWLLWQSATGMGVVTPVPCDAAALSDRLRLVAPKGSELVARRALTALVEARWRQGAV